MLEAQAFLPEGGVDGGVAVDGSSADKVDVRLRVDGSHRRDCRLQCTLLVKADSSVMSISLLARHCTLVEGGSSKRNWLTKK